MSKPETEGYNLGSLQQKIILHLAENGPQTINETARNMKPRGHYKSTWTAFNSLKKKGLIKKVSVKTYRGQEYPQFWLTEEGISSALVNEAKPDKLESNAFRFYQGKNSDIVDFLCELAKASPAEKFDELYLTLKTLKGILKKNDSALLGHALYAIVIESPAYRKALEQALSYLKKFEKGANPRARARKKRRKVNKP